MFFDFGAADFESGFLVAQVFLVDRQAVDVVVEAGELAHEVDGFAFLLIEGAVQAGDGFGGQFLGEGGFGDFGLVLAEFLIHFFGEAGFGLETSARWRSRRSARSFRGRRAVRACSVNC